MGGGSSVEGVATAVFVVLASVAWAGGCDGGSSRDVAPALEVAPAPSESVPSEPVPSEPALPPAGALVVVSEGATLLAEPRLDGPSFGLRPGGFEGRVAEVVGVVEGLLELRTLSDPEPACVPGFGVEDRFALRFFVDPVSLHPVLTRPTTVAFDDGAQLELAAGVPVFEGRDKLTLYVHGTRFWLDDPDLLDLVASALGRWYAPPTAAVGSFTPNPDWFARGVLGYGDHHVLPEGALFDAAVVSESNEPGLVSFAGDCGRVRLRETDTPLPKPDENPLGLSFEGRGPPDILAVLGPEALAQPWGCEPERWVIAAGTPLEWSVGGAAGVATVEHAIVWVEPDDAGRVCFDVGLVHLCAAEAALEHAGDEGCKLGGRGLRITDAASGSTSGSTRAAKRIELVGWHDPSFARRMVEPYLGPFRACYGEASKRRPGLAGEVVIELRASDKVSAVSVDVSGIGDDAGLSACLAKAIRRGRFPKPDNRKSVRLWLPVEFGPS